MSSAHRWWAAVFRQMIFDLGFLIYDFQLAIANRKSSKGL